MSAVDLEGRVAVVTGGASGIGRATVLKLAGRGAKVFAGDYHSAELDVVYRLRVADDGSRLDYEFGNRRSSVSPIGDDVFSRNNLTMRFERDASGTINRNFYDSSVGGPEFVGQMLSTGGLNDGEALTYASGLTVATYRGLNTVSHGGSFVGFRAEMIHFPDEHFSVICLCNRADARPGGLARQVAEVYLGDRMEPREPADARVVEVSIPAQQVVDRREYAAVAYHVERRH